MSDDKALARLGILAFFTTIVFHFSAKMRQEAWKASQPTLPRN